jgi:hypothetical protein
MPTAALYTMVGTCKHLGIEEGPVNRYQPKNTTNCVGESEPGLEKSSSSR